MEKYYTLSSGSMYPDYTRLEARTIPPDFQDACYDSAFQLIDPDKPLVLGVREDSPDDFPDFMYDISYHIPLVSNRMRELLDDFGADYLLYKRIILRRLSTRTEQECWLALPPKINCLDYEKSEIDPVTETAEKIVIREDRTGRYDIFKISDEEMFTVASPDIIITERLRQYLIQAQEERNIVLECVYIRSLL